MKKLTPDDLNKLRDLLLAERASILGDSLSKLEVLELQDKVSTEDQAPILHDQAVALHCRSQEFRKLKQIGAALERLRTGEFGICRTCEEPIPPRRLYAIPWADRCVPCQEQLHDNGGNREQVKLAA